MSDAFLIALQFLTRIPVHRPVNHDERTLGYSVLFYPAVGLLLGGLLAGFAALLSGSPVMLASGLVLSAWVLLTGGLHLDGLADCADAWIGGFGDSQRSLQIMKDPASGPIAVVVLVLLLLLKWSALTALLDSKNLLPLLLVPLLGRCAILLLMLSAPYVRPQGLAEKLLQHLPLKPVRWVACLSLALVVAGLGWLIVALAGALLFTIRRAAMSRLGGVTGDVYGAAVEITETAALLAVALLSNPHRFADAERAGVYRAIAERRDMRHFLAEPVAPEILTRLLQAAHQAGSVGLMQPWRFIRITDRALRIRIHALVEQERLLTAQALADRHDEFLQLKVEGILDCGELLVVALPDRRERHIFGRRTLPEMDLASAACAIQNLWLAARAEGLGMGWVSLFDPHSLAELLNMPEGSQPIAILCLGHVGEFYPKPMLELENWATPRPLSALVSENTWKDDT